LFLERLVKNIRKESSSKSSKSFNLKRMKKLAAEPVVPMYPIQPVEVPVETPTMPTEQVEVDIPRDVRELIDEAVVKGPSPLPIFLFDSPEYINYFKDKINKQAGDPNSALFLLIEYQDATTNAYPKEMNKIIRALGIQTMPGEAFKPQQQGYQGDDLLELAFNKIIEGDWLSKLKRGGYDDTHINESVMSKFSPDVGDTDQRITFFLNRPEYLTSPLKEEIEQAKSGMTNKQMVDYIISNGYASDLYQKMKEMIQNNETFENAIIPWIWSGMKSEKMKQEMGRDVSMQAPVGGKDGTESEFGKNLEDTNKDMSTKREEEEITGLEKDKSKEADKIISMYAKDYLGKILNETLSMTTEITQKALSDATYLKGQGKEKKADKLSLYAQKLMVYIDSAVKQLDNLMQVGDDNSKSRREGAGVVYGRNRKKGDPPDVIGGFVNIPRSEITNLIDHVMVETDIPFEELDGSDPRVQESIKGYIDSSVSEWMPDWGRLVSNTSVNNRFQEVGKLKQRIKRRKGSPPEIIIDQENLYNYFPDEKSAVNFINSTLGEEDDSISREWAGSGTSKAEGGATIEPKTQFKVTFKHFLPYINDLQGKYSPAVMRSFFNLVKPHTKITGAEPDGAAIVKDPRTNMSVVNEQGEPLSYTDMYYKAIGEDIPDILKFKKETGKASKAREMEKIDKDPALTPEQKKERKTEWAEKWDMVKDLYIPAAKKYYKDLVSVKKIDDRLNGIVEDIKDIEYSEGKKVGKDPSKKLLNRKKEKAKLEEEKANLEKEIEFYKGLDYSSKLFANENIFKMVYAAFIEADNKIKKLSQLKSRYNHIKLASHSQSVENMISNIKVDFDNKYGEFIY